MQELFVSAFVTFFVVIDPPGVTPIFAGLTRAASARHKRAMAFKSVAVATGVLLFFAYGGDWLLNQIHVSLDAFRIAGGILLFLIAIDMLFESRTSRREERAEEVRRSHDEPEMDISAFPMGVPLLAGPGAIASVVLFMKETSSVTEQAVVLGAMGANLVICLVLLLAAGVIARVIGETMIGTITRVLGVVLAALSAQFVVDGVRSAFGVG